MNEDIKSFSRISVLLIEGRDFLLSIYLLTTMTTTNISIQDLVQREVIYCVSSLIHTLTKENKLEEEQAIELWTAPIDYGAAKYELELERDAVFKNWCDRDSRYYFGVQTEHYVWKIDPIHNDEETAIYEWFEVYRGSSTFGRSSGSLGDYRQEIFEHYIVTSWLADKLEAKGETVVRDFYGLTIYCRPCTGQALHCDWVIQQIYQDLISR